MATEPTDIKALDKRIEGMAKSIDELRKAILGDEFNPHGYQKRLDALEIRVDNVEDFITKWKWIVMGSIGLGGYGSLTFVQQIIELLSTHKH